MLNSLNIKHLHLGSLPKILVAVPAFYLIFKLSELGIATKYGIADKDEGLYLLAADPPNNSAAWSFPWGWHTNFIYELTSFNLSTFRAVGATALLLISIIFVREIFQYHRMIADSKIENGVVINACILLIGISFPIVFYGSFIFRTPGYNWVNYVGTLLSCTGLIKQLRLNTTRKQKYQNSSAQALFAVGLFFSTPAKPSTPIFLMVVSILFLILNKQNARKWAMTTLSYYGVFVILALIFRVWPMNFFSILLRAFQSPVVDNDQSITGALLNILKTPSYISGNIRSNPLFINILSLALLFTLFILLKRRKLSSIYVLYPVFLICMLLASGTSFQSIDFLRTDNSTLSIWKLSTALLILFSVNVILCWILSENNLREFKNIDKSFYFSISLCIVIPFISSFGSAHGILNMGSLFSASLFLAIVLVSFIILDPKIRKFLVISNLTFAFCLSSVVSFQSNLNPWNIAPPSQSTEVLAFGSHGDQIYVDKVFSSEIEKLRKDLVESGWTKNQPLLGVNWHIASTIPYILGARPPNSLMLTIYGYDNSLATLNYNLSTKFDPYPYQTAWIMTTSLNKLRPNENLEIRLAMEALKAKTSREFPRDYSYVTKAMGTEFWRPKS